MTKKYTETLVIDRSKWLVGDLQNSMLYRPSDRKMCCLGFYCNMKGYKKREMSFMGDPSDFMDRSKVPDWMLINNSLLTYLSDRLITTNDSIEISTKDREKKIKDLFAEAGVKVVFKGKYS